jgi:hypothetical protein
MRGVGAFVIIEERQNALTHNATYRILEEDLVPELRSLLNVFDGIVGAGNYWETIQDATEMAESDRPEARTFFIRDLGAAA